jgi:VHL beta domain
MYMMFLIALLGAVIPAHAKTDFPSQCIQKIGLKSFNSDTPARMVFINDSSRAIETYWIDFGGNPIFYASIGSGETLVQPTYLTHPWIIVDRTGQCIGTYMPKRGIRNITVR